MTREPSKEALAPTWCQNARSLPGGLEHQRVRRRGTPNMADALTVEPGLVERMDEARSQLVVSNVCDQLDGCPERVQITTGVRHAPAGEDRQRSDFDDRAGR